MSTPITKGHFCLRTAASEGDALDQHHRWFFPGAGPPSLAVVAGDFNSVASEDVTLVGQLLGEKLVLNEFFAYQHLGEFRDTKIITDERTLAVTAYALCGFANFASVGIQVAGIAILAPKQRENLATLAWRALLGGTIACLMTAAVAGLLL